MEDPDGTGAAGLMGRRALLWWTLLLVHQGLVLHDVRAELPFMPGNNAAMMVNW